MTDIDYLIVLRGQKNNGSKNLLHAIKDVGFIKIEAVNELNFSEKMGEHGFQNDPWNYEIFEPHLKKQLLEISKRAVSKNSPHPGVRILLEIEEGHHCS